MKTVLITGSSGLIGSACVEKFAEEGWKIIGVDNNMRKTIFGDDGSTKVTGDKLKDKLEDAVFVECDNPYMGRFFLKFL